MEVSAWRRPVPQWPQRATEWDSTWPSPRLSPPSAELPPVSTAAEIRQHQSLLPRVQSGLIVESLPLLSPYLVITEACLSLLFPTRLHCLLHCLLSVFDGPAPVQTSIISARPLKLLQLVSSASLSPVIHSGDLAGDESAETWLSP